MPPVPRARGGVHFINGTSPHPEPRCAPPLEAPVPNRDAELIQRSEASRQGWDLAQQLGSMSSSRSTCIRTARTLASKTNRDATPVLAAALASAPCSAIACRGIFYAQAIPGARARAADCGRTVRRGAAAEMVRVPVDHYIEQAHAALMGIRGLDPRSAHGAWSIARQRGPLNSREPPGRQRRHPAATSAAKRTRGRNGVCNASSTRVRNIVGALGGECTSMRAIEVAVLSGVRTMQSQRVGYGALGMQGRRISVSQATNKPLSIDRNPSHGTIRPRRAGIEGAQQIRSAMERWRCPVNGRNIVDGIREARRRHSRVDSASAWQISCRCGRRSLRRKTHWHLGGIGDRARAVASAHPYAISRLSPCARSGGA